MNLAYSIWLKHQVLIDVFIIALGFVIVNLLIDLTYAWFDPRIRYR